MTRGLWCAFFGALLVRTGIAMHTPVPAEDAANYLWMARAFAAGNAGVALAEVFPPGFPLLLAGPLAWFLDGEMTAGQGAVDAFRVAQWVNVLLGAFAVWPIAALARAWGSSVDVTQPRADASGSGGGETVAIVAAWLVATASLFSRTATDVLSEPAFVLCVAMALLAVTPGRSSPWRFGLWSAAAVWIRPEGVALPLGFAAAWCSEWLLVRFKRSQSDVRPPIPALFVACVPASVALVGLILWRQSLGLESEWLAKWEFHDERVLPDKGDVFGNLLRAPWAWMEAFGPLALGLLWCSFCAWRGRARWTPARANAFRVHAAVGVFALGAIATFVVRRRFFISWTPLVVPGAAIGWCALLGVRFQATRSRVNGEDVPAKRSRWLLPVGVALLCAFGAITAWRGRIDGNRMAERDLGVWLAERLAPNEDFVTDMTRVRYFANRRPLSPRRFGARELGTAAEAVDARAVVLAVRRPGRAELAEALQPRFELAALPAALAEATRARGLVVLTRTP